MRAPVGHAAAGVVAERTPACAVDRKTAATTLRVIRCPRGGAKPHVPVNLFAHLFRRQIAKLWQRPDADVNRLDLAKLARPRGIDVFAVVPQHALAPPGNDTAVA